jgi:4-hydroxy-4-methyl-2-oxoglutarate aldolase
MSRDLIERLRALDACAVSDALDMLSLPGVALGLTNFTARGRIAGRVTTVRLVPAEEAGAAYCTTAPNKRHLGTAAVEGSDDRNVIVVDNGGRIGISGWGGTLSRAAVARGVKGVIVDGGFRDIDEAHDLGLPIYAKAAVPLTARGRVVEEAWGVPVTIAGVLVGPASYVIADGSGVVFIDADCAAQVIAAAEEIAAREARMAEQVDQGVPISEVMGAQYENMLKGN